MANRQSSTSGLTWVGGCAIGCAIATVLLIIGGVLLAYGVKYGMEVGKKEVIAELTRQIAEEREKERMPPEAETVFNESLALLKETQATPMAAFLVGQLFQQFTKGDEQERENILEGLQDLNEFLKANPNANMRQLFEFADKHPTLQDLLKDNQQFTIEKPEEEGEGEI